MKSPLKRTTMPFLPTTKYSCVCVKDSNHKWLSFIEGETYVVNSLKYANEETDTTHNSVEGIWRTKDKQTTDCKRITMSKIDCREFLKVLNQIQ